jgi:phosphopentomutase
LDAGIKEKEQPAWRVHSSSSSTPSAWAAPPTRRNSATKGSDTFGHIAAGLRHAARATARVAAGPLQPAQHDALGLGEAAQASPRRPSAGHALEIDGAGRLLRRRRRKCRCGKDTPSGHWEIAGVPVPFDWGYFPDTVPSFPASLTAGDHRTRARIPGILGDCHASGTEIIERFRRRAHLATGKPICYTSVGFGYPDCRS